MVRTDSGSLELALDQDWSIAVVATYFNAKGSLSGALIEVVGGGCRRL